MDKYIKTSPITNRQYNLFNAIRIKNMKQAGMYMLNKVYPVDVDVERTNKGEPCIVWIYDRDESREVYDKWCKYELR